MHTPRIDALAAEAVRFTRFYVLPLCSPTRSAFLTGRYPIRLGTQATNPDWGKPWGVDAGEVFLGENLKHAGYATALYGKWHVGCHTNASLPNARGFDEFEGFLTGGLTHYTHSTAVYSYPPSAGFPRGCTRCVEGYDWHTQQGGVLKLALARNNTYSSHAIRDAAVGFIERHAPREGARQPWFVYAAFQTVHEPLEVPDEYRAPYNDSSKPSYTPCNGRAPSGGGGGPVSSRAGSCDVQTYCAMATALDAAVGAIVDALGRTGALADTVVVFASDNGAMADSVVTGGMRANGPLKGGKTMTTEGGTRVPAFVHYPAVLKPRWTDAVAHITDLLPTFVLGVARGATAPNQEPLDGFNLWPMLLDPTRPSPRAEVLYNLNPRPDNHDQLHCPKVSLGVVQGGSTLKLSADFWQNATASVAAMSGGGGVVSSSSVRVRLYNLTADAGEEHDVATDPAHRELVAAMLSRLQQLHAESVPPYVAWAPWQGPDYACCNCSESWGVLRDGVKTWEPWLPGLPRHQTTGGGLPCAVPTVQCAAVLRPCRGTPGPAGRRPQPQRRGRGRGGRGQGPCRPEDKRLGAAPVGRRLRVRRARRRRARRDVGTHRRPFALRRTGLGAKGAPGLGPREPGDCERWVRDVLPHPVPCRGHPDPARALPRLEHELGGRSPLR